MQGNLHVRFLGEGVAARSPPYPTRAVGSIPIARSTGYSKGQSSATGLFHFRSCRHGGAGVRAASSSARKTLTLGRRMRLGV